MRVFVYFNLHKKCWSIRAEEGPLKGRVIGHSEAVILNRVTFKVSEAGRQRVLREQRKNVHAGVTGELVATTDDTQIDQDLRFKDVTYNPYTAGYFRLREDGTTPVRSASQAVMSAIPGSPPKVSAGFSAAA